MKRFSFFGFSLLSVFTLFFWYLSPFTLEVTSPSLLQLSPSLFQVLLQVLFYLGTLWLFFQLTQQFFSSWAALLFLLFIVHPYSLESVAFSFRFPDLLGTFFFLLALKCFLKKSVLLATISYFLSLGCSPIGFSLPFLCCFLENKPRFWALIFLPFLGWILGIYFNFWLYPLHFSQDIWWLSGYSLFIPKGPSFPISTSTPTLHFSFWLFFGTGLFFASVFYFYPKKNLKNLAWPLLLVCGTTLSGFHLLLQSTPPDGWNLSNTMASPLSMIGLLWCIGASLPFRPLFFWGIGSLSLLWIVFTTQQLLYIHEPETWLQKRASANNQLEDWIRLAQFYENRAHNQQSWDTLEHAQKIGHDVRLQQLQLLAQTQKTQEKETFAQHWLQQDQNHPYPYQILGEVAVEKGKWEEGIHYFQKAEQYLKTKTVPSSPSDSFYHKYGVALFQTGQIELAQQYFEKAYFLNPESQEISLALAQVYLQKKETHTALFFLRKGLFNTSRPQENPQLPSTIFQGIGQFLFLKYIELLVQQNHLKEALTTLQQAQKEAPEDILFLFYEATLSQSPPLLNFEKAEKLYRQILQKDPKHLETAQKLADILYRKGTSYFEENLLNLACRTFEESLRWNPKQEASLNSLIKAYDQQYELALKKKKPSRMIFFLERILHISPHRIETHLKLAEIYRRKNQYELAAEHYEKILALQSDFAEAREYLALILWKQGLDLQETNPEKAKKTLEKFLIWATPAMEEKKHQIRFLLSQIHLLLGENALQEGKEDEARQLFLTAIQYDETSGLALCRLAELYLNTGHTKEAIAFFEKGIPLLRDPTENSIYQGMFDSLTKEKQENTPKKEEESGEQK